jgi:hypothetical protein
MSNAGSDYATVPINKDEVRKSLNRSRARGALKSVDPYSEHAH